MMQSIFSWLKARENLFFILLIFLHLIPIYAFNYFPSLDGPSHIYHASVLREYNLPERSIFREYYLLNINLVPNWFSHLILAGLMFFLPPLVAEKILLSGYVILLPLSVRYALQAIRPDSVFLAFLAFPFIYNLLLHMGFYNFSYSLPMFFFIIGYWLKSQNQFKLSSCVTLSLLSILLYFCHIVSLVMAYIAIATLIFWLILSDLNKQIRQEPINLRRFGIAFQQRVLLPCCAFFPTIILVVMFLFRREASQHNEIWLTPVWKRLFNLVILNSIASYSRLELIFSTALVIALVATSGLIFIRKLANHRVNDWDGLLLLVIAYLLLYFIMPDSLSGGGNMNNRLLLYPFFALILWLGAQSYQTIVKLRIKIVAVVIAVSLLGIHMIKYAEINNYLEEYTAVSHIIDENETILPITFTSGGYTPDGDFISWRIPAFYHAANYIAVEKHLVNLTNFHASLDYFPIRFRPHLNPYDQMGFKDNIDGTPPPFDFITYPSQTGGEVEYVLLWGLREKQRDHENTQSIFRQLQAKYKLIYTSAPRGFMQLYRRHK